MTDQRTVRGVHWRKHPCPVELRIDDRLYTPDGSGNVHVFACQKQQTWKGPLELPHHHLWQGKIDGCLVRLSWRDDPNGNKQHCCLANLEHLGPGENRAHATAMGLCPRGEQLPQARLTAEAVREIRRLRGTVSGVQLARRFGVAETAISKIQLRRTWRHVE